MDKVLFGRVLDPPLDENGEAQAQALGAHLRSLPDLVIQASPRRRAHQTAAAIARQLAAEVETVPAMDEVDFGSWGGQEFAALAADPRWREWNEHRGNASTPAGDGIAAVQARAVNHLRRLHDRLPARTVAIVTHAEIIRSVLLYCEGAAPDQYHRIRISPASLTTLDMSAADVAVRSVDEQVAPRA